MAPTAILARKASRERPGRPAESLERDARLRLRQRYPHVRPTYTQYLKDPVGFVVEVLGQHPRPHQRTILESVRDHEKTAVPSGQKTGKTRTLIWLALWWYCTHDRTEIRLFSSQGLQNENVLWKEMHVVLAEARAAKGFDLGVAIGTTSESGIREYGVVDGRIVGKQLCGLTAMKREAIHGISSPANFFLVDEATFLSDDFYEAVVGNMAGGGAKLIMFCNPVRSEGPMFDACHSKKDQWSVIPISSEDVARQCRVDGVRYPGMADAEQIRQWEVAYGRDSKFFRERALGHFVLDDTSKVISTALVYDSVSRWQTASDDGVLSLGIDPAGEGDMGDEWAFCLVRGHKMLALYAKAGMTYDEAIAQGMSMLRMHRTPGEVPRVTIDSEGKIGAEFYGRLHALDATLRARFPYERFDLHMAKASDKAWREPHAYATTRDELWASCRDWMRAGGAILPDNKLHGELTLPWFTGDVRGRACVTVKKEIRRALNRSPDRADADRKSVV